MNQDADVKKSIAELMARLRMAYCSAEPLFIHDSRIGEIRAFVAANPQVMSLDQITTAFLSSENANPKDFYSTVEAYFNTWLGWSAQIQMQKENPKGELSLLEAIVKTIQRKFRRKWKKCVCLTTQDRLICTRRVRAHYMSLMNHPLSLRKDEEFADVVGKREEEIDGVDPGRYPDGSI